MTTYIPDKWVIVKFKKKKEAWYKVLASSAGGYLHGSSWRMSSGLVRIEDDNDSYKMHNHSGSVYICHKEMNGVHYASAGVLEELKVKGKEQGITVKVISVKQYLRETDG
jgi:hypothetical protein